MKLHKAILDIARPGFSDVWQGYPTPTNHSSSQGIHTPHRGKEYRGNTRGMRVSGCLSR
jgi:hypothetical protein